MSKWLLHRILTFFILNKFLLNSCQNNLDYTFQIYLVMIVYRTFVRTTYNVYTIPDTIAKWSKWFLMKHETLEKK